MKAFSKIIRFLYNAMALVYAAKPFFITLYTFERTKRQLRVAIGCVFASASESYFLCRLISKPLWQMYFASFE